MSTDGHRAACRPWGKASPPKWALADAAARSLGLCRICIGLSHPWRAITAIDRIRSPIACDASLGVAGFCFAVRSRGKEKIFL